MRAWVKPSEDLFSFYKFRTTPPTTKKKSDCPNCAYGAPPNSTFCLAALYGLPLIYCTAIIKYNCW